MDAQKMQEALREKGYFVFQLFDSKAINSCLQYLEEHPEQKNTFTTHASANYEERKAVHNFLHEQYTPFRNQYFPDHQLLWGNFMLKKAGGEDMLLHADWSYVDETKYRSYNIWSPLVDTELSNGCLWVVPYSHLLVNDIRGVALPRFYDRFENEMKQQYAVPLQLKKGEAVIYDHRLIHFSYPNYSNALRPAVTMIMVPEAADLLHFYFDASSNKILKYHFKAPSFLVELGFFKRPNAKVIEEIEAESITGYDWNEMTRILKKVGFFARKRNAKSFKKWEQFKAK